MTEFCHSQCYNSYTTSETLYDNAHFPCPKECIPIWHICQGVNFCQSDVEVCNKDLICPDDAFGPTKYNLTDTKLVHGHHFCYPVDKDGFENNGQYEIIDRSDEGNIKIKTEGTHINYTELERCNDTYSGSPGVKCGQDCYTSQGRFTFDISQIKFKHNM